MAEEHLEKTLRELQSQRDKQVADFRAELAKLDTAIEAIRKLVQPDSQPSSISVQADDAFTFQGNVSTVVTKGVQAGDFFGKPQADAAREYLKRLGRAATVDDIFTALQQGGVKFKGKDPKKNLYISLTMRKAIFVSVAPYTFGLWEFYPDAREKTGGRLSAQIEEVMQDGKSHRVADIMRMLEEKFGQKVTRSSVGSVLVREDQFRKVRRGVFKLRKEAGS